jgi:hypothetical protein
MKKAVYFSKPNPLRTDAIRWLVMLAPLVGVVYFGVWVSQARALGPYLAVPVLLAWSLLWSRNRRELDRQGARLFTALLSGTALSWVAALGEAYAPQHAPALHLALVVVLWDWFSRRIRTPGKRLVLHSAALWAGAAAWTSHEAPPDDVATEVVLGALAGVVTVWLLPLTRRVALLRAWRRRGRVSGGGGVLFGPFAGISQVALTFAAGRGSPGGESLSLVRTRETNEREIAPTVCDPALRFGQPAVLRFGGVWLNSLRSNNASPDPPNLPLLGAARGGEVGFRIPGRVAALATVTARCASPRYCSLSRVRERGQIQRPSAAMARVVFGPPPVLAGPAMVGGGGIRAGVCLSRRRV